MGRRGRSHRPPATRARALSHQGEPRRLVSGLLRGPGPEEPFRHKARDSGDSGAAQQGHTCRHTCATPGRPQGTALGPRPAAKPETRTRTCSGSQGLQLCPRGAEDPRQPSSRVLPDGWTPGWAQETGAKVGILSCPDPRRPTEPRVTTNHTAPERSAATGFHGHWTKR